MEEVGEAKPGGDGQGKPPSDLSAVLDKGSFANAFSIQDLVSALKMLGDPGEEKEINKLMMRTVFPDPAYLLGFALTLSKCEKFHDSQGITMMHLIAAGLPAVAQDKPSYNRMEMVKQAIIGSQADKDNHFGGGFWSAFKRKAGFGGDRPIG